MVDPPPFGDRPRGRPATRARAERGDALVEAAALVFAREGIDAPYEAIAREAGVSTKTIYAWFGDKLGLFTAVMERFAGRIQVEFRALLARGDGPEATLRGWGELMLTKVAEPNLVALERAVVAAWRDLPELGATFHRLGPGRGQHWLAGYLAECASSGTLAVDDPDRAARTFHGLVSGELMFAVLLNARTVPLPPEEVRERVDYAVRCFLAIYGVDQPETEM